MESKVRKLDWIALLAGIFFLIGGKYFLGVIFILLGVNFFSRITKRYKKATKIEVSDTILDDLNLDLKRLISEGKKIEAIKKYRIITGSGLIEAKKHIGNLK